MLLANGKQLWLQCSYISVWATVSRRVSKVIQSDYKFRISLRSRWIQHGWGFREIMGRSMCSTTPERLAIWSLQFSPALGILTHGCQRTISNWTRTKLIWYLFGRLQLFKVIVFSVQLGDNITALQSNVCSLGVHRDSQLTTGTHVRGVYVSSCFTSCVSSDRSAHRSPNFQLC